MMTPEETRYLRIEMAKLSHYYGTATDDVTLMMYAEDLCDLPLQQVLGALSALRKEPKRRHMPLPADVRERVAPERASPVALANDTAGKIYESIGRFGYTQPDRARSYVGDLGWLVITRMGGYRHLCNTLLAQNMGTFIAQCRDMARSQLELRGPLLPLQPAAAALGAPAKALPTARARSLVADMLPQMAMT